MRMEQPHANQTVRQKQGTFLWKNVPNWVHPSKCVWSLCTVHQVQPQSVCTLSFGTKIDVPARFHCEKVKLLGLLRPRGRSKQNMFWPTQNRCSPNQTRCSDESCSSSYQPNAPLVPMRADLYFSRTKILLKPTIDLKNLPEAANFA